MSNGKNWALLLGVASLLPWGAARADGPGGLTAVPFQDAHVTDAFWAPRIRTNRTATIEANLHQCEITGRIKNFAVAGKLEPGKHQGELYNDSDVYKVLEGIAYTLSSERDPDLERRTDAIIDQIAAAQQPDGYLNTYWTLVKPKERWQHLQYSHELYCAGHLIEAAVAYYQATGKRKLLDVAIRFADYIDSVFGPDRRWDVPGHEEIELALVKLYRVTHEKRYLNLARFFLDARGRADKRHLYGEYAQDHKPLREQTEVTGHAVRAMYLYSGMADVGSLTGDKGLLAALDKIWHDVVDRKMYVTGGIGPSARNEGFTVPYDLPNDSAYCETCAAIGMALWNHRMFLQSGDGKYADVLEREVYNGLLSGVSLDGDRFFYVNPLGSKGDHHREPWFGCSCCPTNIVRYIPGMGERVYAHRGNGVWTVLYVGSTATVGLDGGKVKLTQKTEYPWKGDVTIEVEPEKSFAFDLHLRIPGWCEGTPSVTVNGEKIKASLDKGYLRVGRTWQAGDVVRLDLPMPVRRVHADPHVKADVGRVALQRGPVVYCLEGVDNGGHVRNLCLPPEAKLSAAYEKDLLRGVVVVRGEAESVTRDKDDRLTARRVPFQAVPYSTWDNRKPGEMVVWLPETPELAGTADADEVLSNGVRVRASHCWQNDTLTALNDGVLPKASGDQNVLRMTWWDHRGSTEWVSYRFPQPRRLSGCAVYWFDDTGVGSCRVPAEWRLLWRDGDAWKPVKLAEGSSYGTALDRMNEVRFEPVTARELKLEVRLRPGFSGGILEWTAARR
ncbi:MAG TPA: beta-L-arabinofuranosidase domain-containing protein [Gemmataceae bacterium]|nr:beta-L-arabinofuranosidase domain-containing protein [Gemmataceae bacterium]